MNPQVFLFLLITGAFGCGKSAPGKYRKTMGYPTLTYSFEEGGVHPSPRVVPHSPSIDKDIADESCLQIRPELNQLRWGFSKDWFPTLEHTSPPSLSPLFKFTCQNQTRKDGNGFVIPLQLKAPSFFTKERRSSAVVSFNNLFELFEAFTTNAGKRFAFEVSNPTNPGRVLVYEEPVTVESHTLSATRYKIALANPSDISSSIKHAYFGCEDDDLVCMDQFLKKYGTHVYTEADFGGRMDAFFQRSGSEDQNLHRDLGRWTKSLSEFFTKEKTYITSFTGGEESDNLTPDEWMKSAGTTAITTSSAMTICEAIDPTMERQVLKKTCINVIAGIKTRYRANRLLSAFGQFTKFNELKNALQVAAEDEASRIIPRVGNVEKIENILAHYGKLGAFSTFCRIQEAGNTVFEYSLQPDFCVSAGENFKFDGCKIQDSSLPPRNCVKMYKERGCLGKSEWLEIAKGFENMENYASYMVC